MLIEGEPASKTQKTGTPELRTGVPDVAVAAGFEPAVGGYPTIAFEAITFGRSDTPPRSRLRESSRATKSLPTPRGADSDSAR